MIETPQVADTASQHTAVIHFRIARADMGAVMGPGVAELLAVLAEQGIVPAGPLFTHHARMEPGVFDFDLGFPVATPVAAQGRVQPSQLLPARVARTTYHGAYEGLSDGWGELMAWIDASGHKPGPDLWESYVCGPESGPDPGQWRTQLNRPLVD